MLQFQLIHHHTGPVRSKQKEILKPTNLVRIVLYESDQFIIQGEFELSEDPLVNKISTSKSES
jgi:hypothetical protein